MTEPEPIGVEGQAVEIPCLNEWKPYVELRQRSQWIGRHCRQLAIVPVFTLIFLDVMFFPNSRLGVFEVGNCVTLGTSRHRIRLCSMGASAHGTLSPLRSAIWE